MRLWFSLLQRVCCHLRACINVRLADNSKSDWINDAIKDAYRVKALRARRDIRGRIYAWLDGSQGWVLVAIIGFITACIAFFVDVTENVLFDWKSGYCTSMLPASLLWSSLTQSFRWLVS